MLGHLKSHTFQTHLIKHPSDVLCASIASNGPLQWCNIMKKVKDPRLATRNNRHYCAAKEILLLKESVFCTHLLALIAAAIYSKDCAVYSLSACKN
jgi:hypothetical protein